MGHQFPPQIDWLPGLVSGSVLLWDCIKLAVKRAEKGKVVMSIRGGFQSVSLLKSPSPLARLHLR